jgi:hypothetical protein
MVLETPREIVFPNTTSSKHFNQSSAVPKLSENVRPSRWRYIGKFLIVHTNLEQARRHAEFFLIRAIETASNRVCRCCFLSFLT